MTFAIEDVPAPARRAWNRLRAELERILGDDLVAIWAYGGTITAPADAPFGDLDTFVIVRGPVEDSTARAIEEAQATIGEETGVEWDVWYVTQEDAGRPEMHRHAWRDRLNESWAIDRAHWLGERYVLLHGADPAQIVPPPSETELAAALRAEVDHLERHVEAGDTDPYEATYAFLNGTRIIRALETGDVVISKREAGTWGLEHLPARWHPALEAAVRAYDKRATGDDTVLLAREMAPFVAMVRQRMASTDTGR
ncbi:MAG TPA: aminoglycoside adenylyltransferase domain-containing protein [Candidatus Limnocylindria bacterium]|nr:aminoglycoside adenylyltransferase domain-containing protein [Candidatus Limnocylindria bacterium]